MSLAKPMMRGMLAKRLRLHLPLAFVVSFSSALAFNVRVKIDLMIYRICSMLNNV